MKKVLGLDLGTTSIGWAYVWEAENENEKSSIQKLGVRVVPLSTDEENDFKKGKSISINADRTLKRGARRNLDRYQLRRKELLKILREHKVTPINYIYSEEHKNTFYSYEVRAKAVKEKISKEDFARVLLMINKKRGYKSSRKAQSDDEGVAINGMDVAKYLYNNNLTPGQYVYNLLKKDKKIIPEFYRSDLERELDTIWNFQKEFYPNILSQKLKNEIKGKNKGATWTILKDPFNIKGIKLLGKQKEQKIEKFRLRAIALTEKIDLEHLAIVLQEINNQINHSSGYLGAISDRSKALYFNKQTVGEYLYKQLKKNSHAQLKNQVFYRQDYLDEFEAIWEKQKEYYPELTPELKREIRDIVIFYQRRLKSQKHLISECEFEKHHKAIPKSSPLFQEFKIWQIINNLELKHIPSRTVYKNDSIDIETKELLFNELNIKEKLSAKEVLKILVDKPKEYEINYKEGLEGNHTNAAFYKAYENILKIEGEAYDFSKLSADKINDIVVSKFADIGISQDVLVFNSEIEGNNYDKQPMLQMWHLLYSFEGDNSRTGDEKLIKALYEKFGFREGYAKMMAKVKLQNNYGNLSTKAIRKILPYLKQGNKYDVACHYAGYNHSSSLTKEEQEKRTLKDTLALLPKNSLRNPVVEKILNQLVNVVNAIIQDENLGKPDEIRVELARELKKSAKEREEMTKHINSATKRHEEIKKILQTDFSITKVTRNDIVRYKLWEELESNGYKTLYTDTYIQREKIFSKEFDIEHIIPKALIFDDSFSNKTLSARKINIDKSNETAYDFLKHYLDDEKFEKYLGRVEKLYKDKKISKAKYNKLLMKASEISDGFIDRDLRNSQYIAKKATQMLKEIVRDVNTTSGSITDRLRSDWQLVNVMKELNLPKYEKLGLVESIQGKNGQPEKRIIDWTKRNDHRHHAMDALTVAFTKPVYIQYLNNLHARRDENNKKHKVIQNIESKYLKRNRNGKLLFNPPIPIKEFREEAKNHLESILISFKAKNKVVTRNKNRIKVDGGFIEKTEFTPRGQLHKETVYGKIKVNKSKEEKVGGKFDLEKIKQVAKKQYRDALRARLIAFEGNPKKAFTGKNALSKNPILLDNAKTIKLPESVKLVYKETIYTIRKKLSPNLFKDSKKNDIFYKKIYDNNFIIDKKIRNVLKIRYDKIKKEVEEYNKTVEKKKQKKILETVFSNLDDNPIWLNKEKGISIKRVSITGVNNVETLHYKKDHNGKYILDKKGNKQAVDFVSTGNNHHVAIYRDAKGDLQDEVVSFYDAVARVKLKLPIIWKEHPEHPDWKFQFTMKQNEYFVFPTDDFNPLDTDLLNPNNTSLISPHLFRVQKFSKLNYGNSSVRDYVFRHHLETVINNSKQTKEYTYKNIKSLPRLEGIIKVRINHLGQIIHIGE